MEALIIGLVLAAIAYMYFKNVNNVTPEIAKVKEEVQTLKQEGEKKHAISLETKGTYEQAKNAFINRFGRAGSKPSDPKS